jgi:predicted NBD/HSP70 family sugar kinase
MLSLGLDIGGSHVTAGVVDLSVQGKQPLRLVRRELNSFGTAFQIMESIGHCIRDLLVTESGVREIGIAFPGPLDYEKGISIIRHVGGKFERTFGLHIKQALQDAILPNDKPIRFSNDAHCFAVGACARAHIGRKRTMFLTLGTGLGSAFMENGRLITQHHTLPEIGALYNEPFLASNADQYFSARWFHQQYQEATGRELGSVKELAQMGSNLSTQIFRDFGANLGSFLSPWLKGFECSELVIGGNISKANALFAGTLKEVLGENISVTFCDDTEACIVTGAAHLAKQRNRISGAVDHKSDEMTEYPIYSLVEQLSAGRTAVLDGSAVVSWERVREELHAGLTEKGLRVYWYDFSPCLRSRLTANDLQRADPLHLAGFFDKEKISLLRPDPAADLCIVYGTGATLSSWEGERVFLNLIEEMMEA